MARRTLRIATRKSRLALWQAEHVLRMLADRHPEIEVELVKIVSTGDVVTDRPLVEIGSVGLFTKEVQDAVLDGRADLAVHSLKDLPTQTHPELALAAVPERGTVEDAFLSPKHETLDALPPEAKVATSSLRRRAQLLHRRPDLRIVDIRGNVETRIRKLHEEELDGLILACAGLERLGLTGEITQRLPEETMMSAVGQGALGIECRADDPEILELLSTLEDQPTRQAVDAERRFMFVLEGGCHVPLAARARVAQGRLTLRARVLDADGTQQLEHAGEGDAEQAVQVGSELAEWFLERGVQDLL
ncbi:Porphobilinogen deaminase [Planctomycetes bacterium Pan216]|uniref:Porphobilinogen deaminase n=1 Tax=Kolteria novifilia TaxID=2527975 RepID=A0A518BCV3_9BACT|nr:Porphobilinogen deaminase [Planctomycetes bacterium Pan216]